MAFTALGFDGSIGESEFALFQQLAGHSPCVGGLFDFRVSQQAGSRAVRVAPGRAYKNGVWVENTQEDVLVIAPPDAGQWSMVAIRRDWQTNSIKTEILPGTITPNAQQSVPPSVFPGGYRSEPGVVEHQELYWVWASSTSTSVVLIDLRKQPSGWQGRGTQVERDAAFPVPVTTAQKRALQLSGAEWHRSDRGWTERYFAEFESDFSSGVQRGAAGWYPVAGKLPFWQVKGESTIGTANATWMAMSWYTALHTFESHGAFGWTSGGANISVPFAGIWAASLTGRHAGIAGGQTRGSRFIVDGETEAEEYTRQPSGYGSSNVQRSNSVTLPVETFVAGSIYQDSGKAVNVDNRKLRLAYVSPF